MEKEQLKKENERLKKILQDYCYLIETRYGKVIKFCCEENEESNTDDFEFIKSILEQ